MSGNFKGIRKTFCEDDNTMEMENIFKSISDVVTEIDEENAAADNALYIKMVNKALKGIDDLKEIIKHIMFQLESKEKIREMINKQILELTYKGERQILSLNSKLFGTELPSPLFKNEFVNSIYKRGNLKQLCAALEFDKTKNMLIEKLCGSFSEGSNSRNFNLKVDGYWFEIFIISGIFDYIIDEIRFLIN